MSDRLVEERLSRIAEQVAQAQRNSEATERVREQADSLEVEGTSKSGEVTVVEDPEEKIAGLKLLMRAQTGRDFEITAQQAAGVAVFRFDAESYSVKERKKK